LRVKETQEDGNQETPCFHREPRYVRLHEVSPWAQNPKALLISEGAKWRALQRLPQAIQKVKIRKRKKKRRTHVSKNGCAKSTKVKAAYKVKMKERKKKKSTHVSKGDVQKLGQDGKVCGWKLREIWIKSAIKKEINKPLTVWDRKMMKRKRFD
jgi:hypothetical protein